MILVIYAHPYSGSFNHAVLEHVVSVLGKKGKETEVIDLYADGFNPAVEESSLALYSKGESADPLVQGYINRLVKADEVVFIFPIWWSTMPAMLDGFFDKVMLHGSAYTYAPDGRLIPDKINVERTVMLSTSEAPSFLFEPFFKDYFNRQVLQTVGLKNLEWYNCAGVSEESNRQEFMKLIEEKL